MKTLKTASNIEFCTWFMAMMGLVLSICANMRLDDLLIKLIKAGISL